MRDSTDGGVSRFEVMVVLAVFMVIILVLRPRFGDLVQRAQESRAKAALGLLRSTLQIYYADNAGTFPSRLEALRGVQLDAIPAVRIPAWGPVRNPGHPVDGRVETYDASDLVATVNEGGPMWAYVVDGPRTGLAAFNCSHRDREGVPWSRR